MSYIREEVAVNGYELWLVSQFLKENGKRLPLLMTQTLSHLIDLIITELIWEESSCQDI